MINNTRSQFWRRDDIVLESLQSTYKLAEQIQEKAKTMGNTYYKAKLFPQSQNISRWEQTSNSDKPSMVVISV